MTDQKLFKHQIELEQLYNKNQTTSRIRKEFTECEQFSFEDYLIENEIPIPFGIDLLVQMALHKRCNLPTLIGCLRYHFEDAQVTANMILKCVMADLVDWSPVNSQFIVKFTISDKTQAELDRFQYPLPMVVPPMPIKTNLDCGYILTRSSVILRKNHHDDDVCLDHLNRVNAVQFTINQDTATMVKNQWRNLDKAKPGETKADFQKRKKAFEKYDNTCHDVIKILTKYGNQFYLTHKIDKRGRTYCQGYHITYQGAPWSKAIIELANKELVND